MILACFLRMDQYKLDQTPNQQSKTHLAPNKKVEFISRNELISISDVPFLKILDLETNLELKIRFSEMHLHHFRNNLGTRKQYSRGRYHNNKLYFVGLSSNCHTRDVRVSFAWVSHQLLERPSI